MKQPFDEVICFPPSFLCCSEMADNLFDPTDCTEGDGYRLEWNERVETMWDHQAMKQIECCPYCDARIESHIICKQCGVVEERKRSHLWDGVRICRHCYKLFAMSNLHVNAIAFRWGSKVADIEEKMREAVDEILIARGER